MNVQKNASFLECLAVIAFLVVRTVVSFLLCVKYT